MRGETEIRFAKQGVGPGVLTDFANRDRSCFRQEMIRAAFDGALDCEQLLEYLCDCCARKP